VFGSFGIAGFRAGKGKERMVQKIANFTIL
jgi:hypothetical protein